MSGDVRSRNSDRYGGREHYSSRGNREEYRERDRDRDRRHRSRSPRQRASRREFEPDTYSSSRDYREREREDRYRDRPSDRGWDRDRFRRDDRKRDDERPPRRDRDLFDDRRRPREDEGARGGGRKDRERKKSASPPRKKREPTPDLTDVIPILLRKRRMAQWDIKPPGYENVTAEQAKLSGMFPLPGAPRQQPMDPKQLQAFMGNSGSTASNTALNPTTAKQSKRLFAYNIPSHAASDDDVITEFLNIQLNGTNIVSSTDPCISSKVSSDGEHALLEFKSPEDATAALGLDGISMLPDGDTAMNGAENGASKGLVLRRPKDYIVPTNAENEDAQPGVLSSVVKDSPDKLCISNVPVYLTDEQLVELLSSFGELRGFILAKHIGSETSKGFAFCEYSEPEMTDVAVEGLNGMEIAEQKLKVVRASIGVKQASALGGAMSVNAMSMLAGTAANEVETGRVIQLLNMVTPDELMDKDEYAEIKDDVHEECSKYGTIDAIKIPRPTSSGGRSAAGVGKIFLKYDSNASAKNAMAALAGRKFADRTVVVTWFSEEYFDLDAW